MRPGFERRRPVSFCFTCNKWVEESGQAAISQTQEPMTTAIQTKAALGY